MAESDFITVPVVIPREKLGDLYAIVGPWSQPMAEQANRDDGQPAADPSWKPTDGRLAEQVVAAGNANARAIYRVLAEHAGEPVSYKLLDKATGMENRRRAGVLGSMGKSCWHRGRQAPWRWDRENHTYTMSAMVSDLFKRALATH